MESMSHSKDILSCRLLINRVSQPILSPVWTQVIMRGALMPKGKDMDRVSAHGLMAQPMRVSGPTTLDTAKEYSCPENTPSIMVSSIMTSGMEMECSPMLVGIK